METNNETIIDNNQDVQSNEEITPDKQVDNTPLRDEKGRILPGKTLNPNGRPKGKSLKEYDRERFSKMSDEEKEEFLRTVSSEIRYRMAEGNPAPATDLTTGGKPIPIYGGLSIPIQGHNSDKEDIPTEQAN